jgi:transcriptional regulator with XRE-family HTH domain
MRKKMMESIEDPFNKMIGANLRYCRVLRKLSMTAVSEVIGVAYQQIYKYENGINALTIFRLKQFADFFKEEIKNLINPDYIAIMSKLVEANFFNTSDKDFKLGSVNLATMADLSKNVSIKDYHNTTLHLKYEGAANGNN